MGYKFFSQSAAVALKSNIFVKNINYICSHFIFKMNINMPYKWKEINSSKINFEVKRNTLFCTIFHSFKINFDSTVPFNPHRNQAKRSRLSCPLSVVKIIMPVFQRRELSVKASKWCAHVCKPFKWQSWG